MRRLFPGPGTELEEEQCGERRRQIHNTVIDLEHGVFQEAGHQYDCCTSGSENWMGGIKFCPRRRKVGGQVMFENIQNTPLVMHSRKPTLGLAFKADVKLEQ